MLNKAYIGPRSDIERMIPADARNFLDVGCSNGELGRSIKSKRDCKVVGIELSSEMGSLAGKDLDLVLVGDASEQIKSERIAKQKFDVVIFADILEHLVDPWATLANSQPLLSTNGVAIASIPNIRHVSTICNLLFRGYWPYRDRGIHDSTHLRFFTKKNILELFEHAGFQIETINTNYRFFDKPYRLNKLARVFAWPVLRNFLAYQYIVKARATNRMISS